VKVNTERDAVEAKIHGWLDTPADPGDWVGVFENQDLGHRDLGRRIGLLYGADQWDIAEVGRTTAPDSPIGMGWRFILVAKVRDVDEVLGWFRTNADDDSPNDERI
jgi:hypothetical protein